MTQFEEKYNLLKRAKTPEDVFGAVKELKIDDVTKLFNKIVIHIHPDKCASENVEKANKTFLI
jgi:hypothetical protein